MIVVRCSAIVLALAITQVLSADESSTIDPPSYSGNVMVWLKDVQSEGRKLHLQNVKESKRLQWYIDGSSKILNEKVKENMAELCPEGQAEYAQTASSATLCAASVGTTCTLNNAENQKHCVLSYIGFARDIANLSNGYRTRCSIDGLNCVRSTLDEADVIIDTFWKPAVQTSKHLPIIMESAREGHRNCMNPVYTDFLKAQEKCK